MTTRKRITHVLLMSGVLALLSGAVALIVLAPRAAAPANTARPTVADEGDSDAERTTDGPAPDGDIGAEDATPAAGTDAAGPTDAVAGGEAADVVPEEAVKLGLAGLRHLYPASDERERELLNAACKGAWTSAVNAYRAYAAGEEHRFDESLCRYLITLRAAGLFIDADDDPQMRGAMLNRLDYRLAAELAPMVRAALFDADDGVVAKAIQALWVHFDGDEAVIERLNEIAAGDGPNAEAARRLLDYLQHGKFNGSIGLGGNIGGGGGPSGSGGMVYRRSRGGGGHRFVELEGYTAADIPALTERYLRGDRNERSEVARIVQHYLWPEALPLLRLILTDEDLSIRGIAVATAGAYRTDDALQLLVERFALEPDAKLKRAMLALVLADDTPALPATRESMFLLAIDDDDTVDQALELLQQGRVGNGAVVIDALIVSIFRKPARGKRQLVPSLTWLRGNASKIDVTRAVSDGIAYREKQEPAVALLDSINAAYEAELDAFVIPLYDLAFRHGVEAVRIRASELVVDRFCDLAVPVLRERLLIDSEGVALSVVDLLRVHVEDSRTLALLLDVASIARESIALAIATFVKDVGDTRYIALLLVLGERSEDVVRAAALDAAVAIGDVRHVDEIVRWLADPTATVVLQACVTALDIMRRVPAELHTIAAPWDAHRFVEDRQQLISNSLARVARGDVSTAVWIAERHPRLGWPEAHADYAPAALATWLSNALSIPIATLTPEQVDAFTVASDYTFLLDTDDATIRYQIPSRFYWDVYRDVLARTGERPLDVYIEKRDPTTGDDANNNDDDGNDDDDDGEGSGGESDGGGDRSD